MTLWDWVKHNYVGFIIGGVIAGASVWGIKSCEGGKPFAPKGSEQYVSSPFSNLESKAGYKPTPASQTAQKASPNIKVRKDIENILGSVGRSFENDDTKRLCTELIYMHWRLGKIDLADKRSRRLNITDYLLILDKNHDGLITADEIKPSCEYARESLAAQR